MAARAVAAGELTEEQIMEKKQEIIETYKMMRTNISNIANKISELDGERNEHSLVVKALKDLDPKRRCFQSVGGVLLGSNFCPVLAPCQIHQFSNCLPSLFCGVQKEQ